LIANSLPGLGAKLLPSLHDSHTLQAACYRANDGLV
jgi:hypothetical protein